MSVLDPADLKLQFEALTGSALPADRQSSEYRIPEPRALLGTDSATLSPLKLQHFLGGGTETKASLCFCPRTALGRADCGNSCRQSECKAALLPGFVLSCAHTTALRGCGRQAAASAILTRETRRSPNSLNSPTVPHTCCHLVGIDRGARNQALGIYSLR